MPGTESGLSIQIYGDNDESNFYIICSTSLSLLVYLRHQEWQAGFISGLMGSLCGPCPEHCAGRILVPILSSLPLSSHLVLSHPNHY